MYSKSIRDCNGLAAFASASSAYLILSSLSYLTLHSVSLTHLNIWEAILEGKPWAFKNTFLYCGLKNFSWRKYERTDTCVAILIRQNWGKGLITKLFRWYTSDCSFVIKRQLPFSHVITRWLYICLAVHIYKECIANTYLSLLATFSTISWATMSSFHFLGKLQLYLH